MSPEANVSRRGLVERQRILLSHDLGPAGEAATADALDAAIATWSAHPVASGEAASLPADAERIGAIRF